MNHFCSFPYKSPSINGEGGMGSGVFRCNFPIQKTPLFGRFELFLPTMQNTASVCVTIYNVVCNIWMINQLLNILWFIYYYLFYIHTWNLINTNTVNTKKYL